MYLRRPLYCPICGAKVVVPVAEGGLLPEIHRLPDHYPAADALNEANLCAGVVVTVMLSLDHCSQCGSKIGKHPSGMCSGCYGKMSSGGCNDRRTGS